MIQMRIFYIDYENVHYDGLDGVENISCKDKIIIFGGTNDGIRFSDINCLLKTKAKLEFVTVSTGKKDALDFQLVSHLMLNIDKRYEYFIIAKDTGYNYAIEMANRLGYSNIKRFDSIKASLSLPESSVVECNVITAVPLTKW